MKSNIHPKWNNQTKVTCSCGHTFVTGSTQDEIAVDICSQCHPFYTGEMRFVDTQGRVEKFQAKQKQAAKLKDLAKSKKQQKKQKQREAENPQTLKQMLTEVKKDLHVEPSSNITLKKN